MQLISAVVLAFAVGEASTACQNAFFESVDGHCYGEVSILSHTGVSADSHEQSIEMCKRFNATLPMLKTAEEQDAFWKFAKGKLTDSDLYVAFIGLICNNTFHGPMWADGTPMTYNNLGEQEHWCNDDLYSIQLESGIWIHGPSGSDYNVNILCQEDSASFSSEYQCQSAAGSNGKIVSDYCVKAIHPPQNWPDALVECINGQGTLPIIRSSKANDFLASFAQKNGQDFEIFPIGMEYSGSAWTWVDDGSAIDYSNFGPGFPNLNDGKCGYMITALSEWMNTDCDLMRSPYLCQRITPPPTPVPTTCTNQLLNVGDHFYSPGYPTNSKIACDYILQAPAGKVVELQIVYFDGNVGDELIVDEGTLGGTILANITGFQPTPLIYRSKKPQMWVHWSTKSGRAVGFHAIFQAASP